MKTKKFLETLLAGLTCLSFWSGTGEAADARWDDGVPRYTEAKVIIHEDGPNLLFSDSPEMVQKCGVMYRDTVKGKFRLFFHHVNDTDSSKRLAIVLRRTGIRPALVQLGRNGISDPNRDWLEAGKEAQIRYYGKQKETDPLRISRMTDLLGLQKPTIIRPQELVTGIVNLESDRPVEVSVMMIPVKTDLGLALDAYGILPPDEGDHVLRGTFPASDVHVRLQEAYPSNKLETWASNLLTTSSIPMCGEKTRQRVRRLSIMAIMGSCMMSSFRPKESGTRSCALIHMADLMPARAFFP